MFESENFHAPADLGHPAQPQLGLPTLTPWNNAKAAEPSTRVMHLVPDSPPHNESS